MRQIMRQNRLHFLRHKSVHLLQANLHHQRRLYVKGQCHFGGAKKLDVEKDDIWKELKIEWMRSQLEIPTLDPNDQKQISQRLAQEKSTLIKALKGFQSDVLKDRQFAHQLSHFQLTPNQLSDEIESLCQAMERHDCQQKDAYSLIHYYRSFNGFLKKAQGHAHLTRLSYIMQCYIKLKHYLKVNQVCPESNILNSCPSMHRDVWKRIKYVEFDEAKLDKDYTQLVLLLRIMVGIFSTMDFMNQSLLRTFFQMPYRLLDGLFNYRSKILKGFKFFNLPNTQHIQLMNRIEQGVIGRILETLIPSIVTNKMIFIPSRGDFKDGLDIFQPNQHSIPVRILYNKQLPALNSQQCIQQAFVHIHGGGLMLFTSFITQNHTRLWANQTGVLIFSIDYKLAPQYPFPHAVEDCLQVYRFLTNQIHKYLNIRLKRTFVGGDSAGGNLSCALVALILKNRLLKPSSMFLIYPSLDLRKLYYPSRQYFLIDPLLWPSLGILVIDSYLKDHKEAQNPLASPLLLTQEYITGKEGDKSFPREWPRTQIIIGVKDPLRDETLILMQKMAKSGIDCKCTILQGFRHGFMNTDQYIRQSEIPFKISVDIIKKMVQQARSE